MKKSSSRLPTSLMWIAVLLTAFVTCALGGMPGSINGPKVVLKAAKNDGRLVRIPPPASSFNKDMKASTFTIRYLNAGETNSFGDTCIGWPGEAKAAFTYAAQVWGGMIKSTVPISINACWANLTPADTLGHGGASKLFYNFNGAPLAETFFPVSLANARAATDLYPAEEKIIIAYNAQQPWYFGTDGNCPVGKYDFASVIMHEICHGLGFLGSWGYTNGLGSWGDEKTPNVPYAYDRLIGNKFYQALLNTTLFPNPSAVLAAQLTGNNLFFYGTYAMVASGKTPTPIYAPATWSDGSSACHLGEIYRATANGLMVHSLADGYSIHNPGPITLGLLRDVGWTVGTPPAPLVGVNGSTNDITLTGSDAVTVAIALNPGNSAGENKDWWVVAITTVGTYYYQPASGWIQVANVSQVRPAYQGPLAILAPATVLSMPSLSTGSYRFYFGVDAMNGVIDPDIIYATVQATVP